MSLSIVKRTRTATPGGVVGLMISLSVMSYFDRTIMSIAGPEIIKEFSVSETGMGAVYSAFILSYALLMIPGGRMADRFGARRVLAASGLGAALFTAITALGARPSLGSLLGVIPAFVLIRLGLGSFTAPLYPACARMNANRPTWNLPLNSRCKFPTPSATVVYGDIRKIVDTDNRQNL